nr:hypothetical protein [Tanacetum cinerariifolium]
MASFLPLIEELACVVGSNVTKDQLVVLFEREIAGDVGKIKEFRRSCDDILRTIEMLRRMQLDDTKKAARLLSIEGDSA